MPVKFTDSIETYIIIRFIYVHVFYYLSRDPPIATYLLLVYLVIIVKKTQLIFFIFTNTGDNGIHIAAKT